MITGTFMLTGDEARVKLGAVKQLLGQAEQYYKRGDNTFNKARLLLLELYEYEGWKALGYPSWRACVKAEFETGQSELYRQLAAAVVENEISPNGGIGSISERVLRPLTRKKYSTLTRIAIWEIAKQMNDGNEASITSGQVNAIAETLGEALVTGTLTDANGEQAAIRERFNADVINRMAETRRRQQDHIQNNTGSVKVLSAMPAKTRIEGSNSVLLEVIGTISPAQLQTLLKAKNLKITVWIERAE